MLTFALRIAAFATVLAATHAALAENKAFDMCKVYKTHCKVDHHCETVNGKPQCVPNKPPPVCRPVCKAGETCEAVHCIKAPCPAKCVKK